MINNPGRTFDLYCVAEVLGTAFPRAFSTTNIVSGFRKSGIFPLDRGVFCEDDFLGAYVTDREIDLQAATPSSSGLNLQPQNSGTSISETPEAYQNSKKIVMPEEVQPCPKAMPRKLNTRGRRAGRTRIATNTPEKEEIRSLKEKRASKTRPKVARTNLIGSYKMLPKGIECHLPLRLKMNLCLWSPLMTKIALMKPAFSATKHFAKIRCLKCLRWSHELCAGIDKGAWKTYVCDICK
ncbi:hypothetical protein ANN_16750 [Periplaneta americana]|uniref:Zinc finger PHD-type domain-containing protein n=1 Tax=Periplaneta americana TaxID=6978 RepID=A0ABQ8SQZ2_PERAM|nr:hypothetical protein ANN_16750 [Periplaneta americana]